MTLRDADAEAGRRLADAVTTHYALDVRSLSRIAKGMGTTNWRVCTSTGDYFLKQYPPDADVAGEVAALELSQEARAAGVSAPRVILSSTGEFVRAEDGLAFALLEYLPGTTSGGVLSRSELEQAGTTLGRLHALLRNRRELRETAEAWLALDMGRKRAAFARYLSIIEGRAEPDAFDRRTAFLLRRRLELLPKVAALLASLPPLARQVVHGDYGASNLLFRDGVLAAVIDFRPPERFLPAFEIGRTALDPETLGAGQPWVDKSLAFVDAYCRANPDIGRADVQFAPQVWTIQLVRSEYGARQHYFGPRERQADLDRFWVQRCEAAEMILHRLDELSESFGAAWDRQKSKRVATPNRRGGLVR